MQYGDPRDARRAARDARRAAHRYARDMRRMNRYGRPISGLGLVFLIFLGIYIVTHTWAWLLIGIIALVVISAIWRRSNQSWQGPWQNYYQPPQTSQSPYQSPQEAERPYQEYEQGYQPTPQETYEEGGSRYQYPPQASSPDSQRYEGPQAQYPEQMPPMQQ